jgi:Trypsin-like peptidase domain
VSGTQVMKYISIIGFTVAIVCIADVTIAKTPAEIEAIAKAVTVEIRAIEDSSVGSGIIIERKGTLYTLITNRHVVCGRTRNCKILPPGFSFDAGQAIAVVDKRLTGDRGGYTVIYNAQTQPGMSGGGVFDRAGRLVAIHG